MTPELPIAGGCRCGRVRFRIDAAPMLETVCHCRGCQRMTGSAFSTTVVVPEDGFAVTEGGNVIGGLHGDQADHHHCDWSKSWIFTTLRGGFGTVNVRATLLDDATWFAPLAETATSEKLAWVQTGAQASYPGFPSLDGFQAVVANYRAARPGG